MFLYFLINVHAQIKKWITKQIRLTAQNGWMKISLKTLSDAKCGVGDLEIFSVYPRLFEVFFSSFPSLPECPIYKPSITQLSCGFYAWIKLYFCKDILDNQSYNQKQKKKWFVFKLRKLIEEKIYYIPLYSFVVSFIISFYLLLSSI